MSHPSSVELPAWPVAALQAALPHMLRLWCVAVALYLPMMAWLMWAGGDFVIADRLYALQGGTWQLRERWLTAGLIHAGGKRLSILLWLAFAIFAAVIWRRPEWRAWRTPLLVLLASVPTSCGLVAAIKHTLPMACPWDLLRYGGQQSFIGLLEQWPVGVPRMGCFPAAHASSGFAWIALYFLLLRTRRQWRWYGLAVGLAMGGVFAASQELRGAHFLSHDLTTLLLCWTVALLADTWSRNRAQA